MRAVCEIGICTECGACKTICPKQCIHLCSTDEGVRYMAIDDAVCISCGLCTTSCPACHPIQLHHMQTAYAAKRKPEMAAKESASGGVASAIYEYALSQGMLCAGVVLDTDQKARFLLTDQLDVLSRFRNSKYTYSDTDGVYKSICQALRQGKEVVFVGLPCQVAGMRQYAEATKCDTKGLYCVDLVCHGTPPPEYLVEHVAHLSGGEEYIACHFRDHSYDTSRFMYTLYHEGAKKPFYKKAVDDTDLYQIGYHNALIYRDVCYRCVYAQKERGGDITIGDYHGIGLLAPWNRDDHKLSCLVVNTPKGQTLIKELMEREMLTLWERPLEEPIKGEPQFRHPSIAPPERTLFLARYRETENFESASAVAFEGYVRRNRRRRMLFIPQLRRIIRKVTPRTLRRLVRKVRNRKS